MNRNLLQKIANDTRRPHSEREAAARLLTGKKKQPASPSVEPIEPQAEEPAPSIKWTWTREQDAEPIRFFNTPWRDRPTSVSFAVCQVVDDLTGWGGLLGPMDGKFLAVAAFERMRALYENTQDEELRQQAIQAIRVLAAGSSNSLIVAPEIQQAARQYLKSID